MLLETPIAHDLEEADDIIRIAEEKGLKVEVAEQFHRRPLEQLKLKLIDSGLFGKVYVSFNDYAGHGYHGISVMRSYLGFDARPLRVTGSVHSYDLLPHWSHERQSLRSAPRDTGTRHRRVCRRPARRLPLDRRRATIRACAGGAAAASWPEKGMGVTVGTGSGRGGAALSLLAPGGEAPQLHHRWSAAGSGVDGGALVAMVAHTGGPGRNPSCRGRIPSVRRPAGARPTVARRRNRRRRMPDEPRQRGPRRCANPPTAPTRPDSTRN